MKKFAISILRTLAISLPLLALTAACDDDDDDTNQPPVTTPSLKFENVVLSGENERPDPVETTGTGTFDATYNDETNVLSYSLTWQLGNRDDQTIAMHFHGPATPEQSAGPVVNIEGFTNEYSGTLSDETDPLTAQQEAELKAGLWYINVHSTSFPNGELRGNLLVD